MCSRLQIQTHRNLMSYVNFIFMTICVSLKEILNNRILSIKKSKELNSIDSPMLELENV